MQVDIKDQQLVFVGGLYWEFDVCVRVQPNVLTVEFAYGPPRGSHTIGDSSLVRVREGN